MVLVVMVVLSVVTDLFHTIITEVLQRMSSHGN